jgi:hypothetical protein
MKCLAFNLQFENVSGHGVIDDDKHCGSVSKREADT